ncbi:MAG: dihydrolipoamide acetyltransferase family protein [Bacillota bacterium]|nr:dihydrolipoamide acetyltransferase family protein [Bacillota bacterium]
MYKFKFADVGEGIHEGIVFEWYVKEGDQVAEGQEIYSVETDKFTTDVTSPVAGIIKKIYTPEGTEISVGDLMVDIDDGSGDDGASEEAAPVAAPEKAVEEEKGGAGPAVVGAIESSDEIIESYTGPSKSTASTGKALATPVARNFAKQLGVDINLVPGTGSLGRVTKEDIQKFVDGSAAAAPASAPVSAPIAQGEAHQFVAPENAEAKIERVKMSKMRETIAKNMVQSKFTIPHTSTMFEFDVTELWELRKELNASLASEGTKLSFMPFVIKAVVAALKKYPMVNTELDEVNREIIFKKYYNISMAVDTEYGLAVPIIKDADQKSLMEIHNKLEELMEQARTKSLPLDSMTGGTFSISNYGAIGGTYATPVINYPESAILGTGAIYKKPVFNEKDEIVARYYMPVVLSFDHRVMDGADANRFVMEIGRILSSKHNILLN